MVEEGAHDDLDVELQWPNIEAPAATPRASKQPEPEPARPLAPVAPRPGAKGGAAAGDLLRRIEMLARAVERIDPSRQSATLGRRIDELVSTMDAERQAESKRAGDRAKKTSAQLTGLAKRVDELTRTVEQLLAGSPLGDLVAKVDALSTTVDVLAVHLGSMAAGYEQLRRQVELGFEPLREATLEVRRLSDIVVGRGGSRSGHQNDLRSQVETLADDIRELRRMLPVRKGAGGSDLADVIAAGVAAALAGDDAEGEGTPAPKRRRAKPASTAKT